ncbi:hypothetical protein A3Q56_01775 [Intoshia linei]|uniref:Prefoldin subunit 4 n=1 Tax=Intoshia linei TaxID=1819745 RepID=A0A177B842_9BILA|nr:hypothetical protein A3Q56_01775 [Intoshia linei]
MNYGRKISIVSCNISASFCSPLSIIAAMKQSLPLKLNAWFDIIMDDQIDMIKDDQENINSFANYHYHSKQDKANQSDLMSKLKNCETALDEVELFDENDFWIGVGNAFFKQTSTQSKESIESLAEFYKDEINKNETKMNQDDQKIQNLKIELNKKFGDSIMLEDK